MLSYTKDTLTESRLRPVDMRRDSTYTAFTWAGIIPYLPDLKLVVVTIRAGAPILW